VQGLADFKLKLASGLTGGAITVAHCHVEISDSDAELARKVLGNNASAALALRDMLDVKALTAAIELLRGAQRLGDVAITHLGAHEFHAEPLQGVLPAPDST